MTLSSLSGTDARRCSCVTTATRSSRISSPSDQGSDKPGRGFASAHATRRSAMEPTDWHDIEEHRFAERVSEALERLVRARGAPALVVAAPPRTLADLREALHPDVKARIVLQIDRDFTNQPVWEIERHVVASLESARA
ncbi:MAG TPA: host attachment protein [Roseiarcus sp.]|nr:host attachment protein [Roseiarcus sp.]